MRPALKLNIPIYDSNGAGIPTQNAVLMSDLGPRLDSYEHTIAATFGFESMRCSYKGTFEDALYALNNFLCGSTIVTGPDAEIVWEGFCTVVEVTFAGERRSLSIEKMANRVKARYATTLGSPGATSTSTDSASIALYGNKDAVLSLPETTSTGASNLVTAYLAEHKNPLSSPSSEIATGAHPEITINLTFAGWYAALDWLLTSNSATSTAVTTTQVTNLITSYNGVNNWFSSDYTQVTASGISDTQYIVPDTTYRQAIERLLAQGNGTNRYAWGVYEGRRFVANVWAGATPIPPDNMRWLAGVDVYDSTGNIIAPYNVRPDAMYQVSDLLDPSPVASAQDAASRYYVDRVTCSIQGGAIAVRLEPAQNDSFDARLARLGGR